MNNTLSSAEKEQLIERIEQLEKEKEELQRKLQTFAVRMESGTSGPSVHEYVDALKKACDSADDWTNQRRLEAEMEADAIVEKARRDSEVLAEKAKEAARDYLFDQVTVIQMESREARAELAKTREECEQLRRKTEEEIAESRMILKRKAKRVLQACDLLKTSIESAQILKEITEE